MRESHLSIRVSSEEKSAWRAPAESRDLSVGQLVRRAMQGLANDPEVSPVELKRSPAPRGVDRTREIAWLQVHGARLRADIPGHWVILQGDELIAHGTDYLSVLAEARTKGVAIPFVERIPDRSGVVWMGL